MNYGLIHEIEEARGNKQEQKVVIQSHQTQLNCCIYIRLKF